jgi:drug/metabolite transporter (DMT)-like permease
MEKRERVSHILLGMVVFIWGANIGIIKSAYQDFHPIYFAALRFALSGVLILFAVFLKEGDLRIRRQDWGTVLVMALPGMALYQILWSLGLDRTTATNSALILALQPIMAAAYVDLTKKESISKQEYWGMLLAFTGVLLIILKPSARLHFSLETLYGDALTLVAAGCFAVFCSSWSKPLLKLYSSLRVTGYSMALSSAFLWIAVLVSGPHKAWGQIGLHSWYSLGYAVFLSGIVAHVAWYEGIGRIGVAKTMIYVYLIPIAAALFNHFAMGEKLYVQQLIGGGLILWGVRSVLRN